MKRSICALVCFLIAASTQATLQAEDLTICIQAWRESQLGNYDKAMKLFEKGIETGDLSKASLAQTYRNMGITSRGAKKYEQAIKFYDKALELKPTDPWSDIVNKGNVLSDLGRNKEAFAQYDKAQKLRPNFDSAYFNRGILFEKLKQKDKALEQFKKAYEHGLRTPALRERFVVYGLIGTNLPPVPAPKGYEWAPFAAIGGFFLKPDAWHATKLTEDSYAISKEKPDKKTSFETGMTINAWIGAGKAGDKKTADIVLEKFKAATKDRKITKEWRQNTATLQGKGFRFENEKKTLHNLLISNSKTGTVYHIIFQAPTKEWEKTWKTAEPMLKYLLIDDEV